MAHVWVIERKRVNWRPYTFDYTKKEAENYLVELKKIYNKNKQDYRIRKYVREE